MLSAYYQEWGRAEAVLNLGQLPVPELENAEDVLVAVRAASINPADWKQMGRCLALDE